MDWYTPPDEPVTPPPVSRLWCFIKGISPPVLHFLFMWVAIFLIALPVMYDIMDRMDRTGMTSEEIALEVTSSQEYQIAAISASVYSGILSVGVFSIMYRRRKPPYAPERERCPGNLLWLVAIIAIAGNFALSTAVEAIQALLGTNLPVSSLDGQFDNMDDAGPVLLALMIVFIAPIAEELCFRGLALNRLMAAFPFRTANVIQAALFGIIHLSLIQSIYAFLFGLLLGWIYHKTGRFGAAVLAHIVFNFSPALSGFVPESLHGNPFLLFLLVGIPSATVLTVSVRTLRDRLATPEKGSEL